MEIREMDIDSVIGSIWFGQFNTFDNNIQRVSLNGLFVYRIYKSGEFDHRDIFFI